MQKSKLIYGKKVQKSKLIYGKNVQKSKLSIGAPYYIAVFAGRMVCALRFCILWQ